MVILHQNCEPELALDKSLPRDSYLVSYLNSEDIVSYDIIRSTSKVEAFDFYWDTYRSVIQIEWTKGTVNPKKG